MLPLTGKRQRERSTAARADSGVHAKIVSDRIGHAHEGITVQIYGDRSTGHDQEAAELVAGLIRRKLDGGPTADVG